ncbi:MAG: hypothetical protein ABI591_26615 [Kofleriaceae bacterium]
MPLDDVRPGDCYAHARRLLAEVGSVRAELGRGEDTRAVAEVADARPRDCYFEALATWSKVDRLAREVGAPPARAAQPIPALRDLRPGHVLQLITAMLEQVDSIKAQLRITETAAVPAVEAARQPSDVLATLIRINREVSRALDCPFTASDVYRTVALASAYATRLGAPAGPAPFTRGRKPQHCYERLLTCHALVSALIAKHGEPPVAIRSTPPDVVPGDVYDLASVVLGELALLHSLTPTAVALHAFEPNASGHRLPAHVEQLTRTLEAQLAALS